MADQIYDFSTFPILTTNRLILRQPTHGDADGFIAVFKEPEVLRFLNVPPVNTRDKAIVMIDEINERFAHGQGLEWAFTRRTDGQVIGLGGVFLWVRSDRKVDLGYHIHRAEWGKGYATEAAHAMIRWAFENMNLHRIQADITEGNLASERVLLKCGFTVEGVWRESCWEHERFVNLKQFGLLHREYNFEAG